MAWPVAWSVADIYMGRNIGTSGIAAGLGRLGRSDTPQGWDALDTLDFWQHSGAEALPRRPQPKPFTYALDSPPARQKLGTLRQNRTDRGRSRCVQTHPPTPPPHQ